MQYRKVVCRLGRSSRAYHMETMDMNGFLLLQSFLVSNAVSDMIITVSSLRSVEIPKKHFVF